MKKSNSVLVQLVSISAISTALLFGSGCRSSIGMGDAITMSAIDEEGKIPTEWFMGNPVFSIVALSPSGKRLAVLVSKGQNDAVMSLDLETGKRTNLAVLERRDSSHSTASNRIRGIGWASEDYVVITADRPAHMPLLTQFSAGVAARRSVLLSSDVRNPRVREIGEDWPYAGWLQFQDSVIDFLPDDPDHLLISWFGQAQRVDLKASRLRGVELSKQGVSNWRTDHKFEVRVGHSFERHNTDVEVWGRVSGEDQIEKLVDWDPFDPDGEGEGFFFAGFSDNPEMIYVRNERLTGRAAIYEYDLRNHEMGRLVFGDPKYAIGQIRSSRVDGRLLAITYLDGDAPKIRYFDEKYRRLWEPIHQEFEGKLIDLVSSDRNETSSVFSVSSDDSPPVYFRLDHSSGRYSRLFRGRPRLDNQTLSKTEPVQFQSRDGLTIHGYLTRPVNAKGPTATIVIPHGGPFARDFLVWDPRVQLFASRGFAVFQLNQRGSVGYGRRFREAGYQEYGLKMQDDITDGVRWLIEEGVADAGQIGIFGIGYGGYAALRGLTSTPELYAAGASYGGISDLLTLLGDDVEYVGRSALNRVLIGSRWTDRNRLREISPAYHADKIKAPVLLGHGTDDWNFHIRHTDKMATALEKAGVEHEIYRYLGESHDFLDERTRIGFYQKLVDFFERHLKPDPAHVRRPVQAANIPAKASR